MTMKLAIYTECVSPHQLPMAKEIAKFLDGGNFCNIYDHPLKQERIDMGWNASVTEKWEIVASERKVEVKKIVESAEVLMSSMRDLALFEHRSNVGLLTVYYGERWFKPRLGMLRLMSPSYLKMAWRFIRLLRNRNNVVYYPMGIHAAGDMARLCGLFSGDFKCLFRTPKLEFERRPGGRIWLKNDDGRAGAKYCLDKMRMWGYFVEPSKYDALPVQESAKTKPREIRVLWVGRLLNLKRVDAIVRAVGEHANLKRVDDSLPKMTLDIYGTGPKEKSLKKMAAKYGDFIRFHPPVPISEVRRLMREHDVYVLASNGYEGWGAVVSEALEEGMKVVGTYEAGSSGTMLPKSNLFHAGDWKGLLNILRRGPQSIDADVWSAASFAKTLVNEVCK